MPAKNTYRCVAIDDEPLALDLIEKHLSGIDFLELAARFTSPVKALEALPELKPDVLYLDVEMPGMTGLDLIRSMDDPPLIILTTAYSEYAAEAFELDVFDYIVKPITISRFTKSVDKLRKYLLETPAATEAEIRSDELFIKVDRALIKIKLSDILYVQGLQKYLRIFTKNGNWVTLMTMTNMRSHLSDLRFYQVHKSYLVNLDYLDRIEGLNAVIGEHHIPIAKANKSELLRQLKIG